ncbi:unnamed protein product [Rodentolepis nana]|uniref:SHNi-TPR domain-containing protein n=1 Tax=Rodentolepis nana TaxID=102285 RepID=A0A0R3TJQ1_RODNA|nr:unnamed protein product [Rodentolepis nana]
MQLNASPRRAKFCKSIACSISISSYSAQQLGDLHSDLAMPNLLYGTALLELARAENDVFGEQGDCIENPNTSEEKTEEPLPSSSTGVTHETEEVDEIDDHKDGGEISTLQLAWEVVEVARSIFSKHDDVEHRLKCAECLERLGEIGQESGNIEAAIKDLLECLEIRKKDDPKNLRLIALTHFQLALAHSYKEDFKSANDSFGEALEYLKESKAQYESDLCAINKEDDAEKDRISVLEVYISEVDGLIKDIGERRKEICESSVVVKEAEASQPKTIDKDSPVVDISHLVKKKRSAEEEQNADLPAKKARVDDVEDKKEEDPQQVENGKSS